MDMPPTRYRVVEQGRRLVVIDNWAGAPVRPVTAPPPEMPGERRGRMEAPKPAPSVRAEARGRYAGGEGFSFVTARLYDDEGPRRIRMNKEGQTQLVAIAAVLAVVLVFLVVVAGWLLFFPLVVLALNPKARGGLRTAATTWLTALDTSEG
jgi:hypothetical protein